MVAAPFMALLLYTFTSYFVFYCCPLSWDAVFHFPPRALMTPLFAMLFNILMLPRLVALVERNYLKVKEEIEQRDVAAEGDKTD